MFIVAIVVLDEGVNVHAEFSSVRPPWEGKCANWRGYGGGVISFADGIPAV
jgi:hypothetical protein